MITLPDVKIVGTLTADPELRFTQSGKAVANFSIACNQRKKNADGTWEDGDATFVRANIWGEYAENVAESLVRGLKVIAFGQLKQRSYETNDGEKRTVFELEVEEIGPALRFATAKVSKTAKNGGGNRQPAAAQSEPASDPWGTTSSDAPAWA